VKKIRIVQLLETPLSQLAKKLPLFTKPEQPFITLLMRIKINPLYTLRLSLSYAIF
jgi:hypothetical protein